ncbi:hypothetical protein ACFC5X_29620 [Streptomyces sp. NPDC055952]|uniref:hypothetical protein n=1 Tax=Streptomyces sp. NPDC055952 TaxID=3345663 RepID=UPI0035DB3523
MNGARDKKEEALGTSPATRGGETAFEERVRALLAEDASAVEPSAPPCTAIRRRGVAERRRRAVTGAVLVSLVAVPAGAYAVASGGPERAGRTAADGPRDSTPRTPPPSTAGPGPGRPATDGQLLDGITFAQASDGLAKCLASERGGPPAHREMLGEAKDYRIIWAARSTTGAATGTFHVVGVKDRPAGTRVVCDIEDGEASGISTGTADSDPPDAGPVVPEANAGRLHQPPNADKGGWKLPFRWGVVGRVEPAVAEVTVSYGGVTRRAVLDHGWFVASGLLGRQVTDAPHIKGYDSGGKLLYDSDQDEHWDRTLS